MMLVSDSRATIPASADSKPLVTQERLDTCASVKLNPATSNEFKENKISLGKCQQKSHIDSSSSAVNDSVSSVLCEPTSVSTKRSQKHSSSSSSSSKRIKPSSTRSSSRSLSPRKSSSHKKRSSSHERSRDCDRDRPRENDREQGKERSRDKLREKGRGREKDRSRERERARGRDRIGERSSRIRSPVTRSSHREYASSRHDQRRTSRKSSQSRRRSNSRSRSPIRPQRRRRSSSRSPKILTDIVTVVAKQVTEQPPRSPIRTPSVPPKAEPLTAIERDRRTVFVAQLHHTARERDVRNFFEGAGTGRVRDIRLISDKGSRRMKGIGYIEFVDETSVEKALALAGTKLMGVPVIVERTESEKNRAAEANSLIHTKAKNIDRNGKQTSPNSSSLALSSLGLPQPSSELDDAESTGLRLNPTSRAELMQKLARGNTDTLPQLVASFPTHPSLPQIPPPMQTLIAGQSGILSAASVATKSRCLLLTNMFNPSEETEPNWEKDIEEDVREECNRSYGHVSHIHVVKESQGHVFVRFQTFPVAEAARSALNGRWFSGRQVSATYLSEISYNAKFPESD